MTATRKKNDNSKKKIATILIGLLLVIGILLGSLFAFFSDIVTGTENVTAGTLGLSNTANFYINGSSTPAIPEELDCINPGDTIKAVIGITNEGNKSAWLQNLLVLSGTDGAEIPLTAAQISSVFTVYQGTDTSVTPLNGSGTDSVVFTDAGKNVIDGKYETETGTPPNGVTFIGATSTEFTFTIVFDGSAGNIWQATNLTIGYEVDALQYRNNPTPNWTEAVENTYKEAYGIVTP